MMADLHLPIRPRSDLALLNGLIRVIIEQDLVDRRYIERHTTGFDALRESVAGYTLERVAEITGLTPELICRTAWLYARARAAFIGWTMGVNHSTKGTETVNAINNLALITGNIGRAGASPFSITGQCNAMGTREAGFASSLARLPQVRGRGGSRRRWPPCGTIPVERIPTARGLAYPDIIEAALDGRIRALWIIATNPIVSFPNLGVLQQALRALWSSSSSRTASIQRRRPRWRTSCCRRRSGARRRGPTRTRSGASARSTARSIRQAKPGRLRHLPVAGRDAGRDETNSFLDGRSPKTRSTNGSASPPVGSATTRA